MEALLLAIVIGLAMLFSGIRLVGMLRWSLIAGGLVVLLTTLSRTCEANPGLCSLDWVFETLQEPLPLPDVRSPSPGFPAPDPTTPSPDDSQLEPETPYPEPPSAPYPDPERPYPDDLPPADTQPPSPAYPPFRSPTPAPTPRPSNPANPDRDPCVDYKCLW